MPWQTPLLSDVRSMVRDYVRAQLPGSDATIPNSVLRVMSDSQGGLCHLTLQYIDWLALQLLPDTAETEWLDRHGAIWLVNADGTVGRKQATLASGSVAFTGNFGMIVPSGSLLTAGNGVTYQTTQQIVIGNGPTEGPVQAVDPGAIGNQVAGAPMGLAAPPPGVNQGATVVSMDGGTDTETDDQLRARILQRIQQPPMGGAENDYVAWALACPGVTRAWAYPNSMGAGTITVRFLMDDLRASDDGWPTPQDVANVAGYIDQMRPVAVKDCYVVAPIKYFIDVTISELVPGNETTQAAIEQSLLDMLLVKAAPGQNILAAWVNYAIMNAPGVEAFDLVTDADYVMPGPGYMAVLGTVLFE